MSNTIFDDFDEQSQEALRGLKFLSFEDVKRGLVGSDPFEKIRTNKILIGETIRGMTNVHPLVVHKFNNRKSEDIKRLYFPDAEKKFLSDQGIDLNIDVDCEEARQLFINSTDFFYDYNKNKTLDDGEFAFQMLLFASKNSKKLQEAFECVKPEKGQMLIFIENNKDDWSNQWVRIKIAQDVQDTIKQSHLHHSKVLETINSKTSGLSQEDLKQLIETGQIEEKMTVTSALLSGLTFSIRVILSPALAVGWVLEQVGKGAALLSLPETVWDTQNENYILKRENVVGLLSIDKSLIELIEKNLTNDKSKFEFNDLIPDYVSGKIIEAINVLTVYIDKYNAFIKRVVDDMYSSSEKLKNLQRNIAGLTGVYNGLIDFIASTLQFLGSVAKAPYEVVSDWQGFFRNIRQYLFKY